MPPRETVSAPVSRKQVVDALMSAVEERDDARRANICIALVELGVDCRKYLFEIVLDKSRDFQTRRYALKVASAFRDKVLESFIRSNCLAGKTRGQLLRALGDDQESHAQIALFVTGEEILSTPDFFQKYVAKNGR